MKFKNDDSVIFQKDGFSGAGYIRGSEEVNGQILYLIEISSIDDEDYPDSIIAVFEDSIRMANYDEDLGYTQGQADIMNMNEEIEKLRNTLRTLICWLVVDLGEQNVKDLLKKLDGGK